MTEQERLKELLEGRKEEYEIFGRTASDVEQDNKIKLQIKTLRIKELEERISRNKFVNDLQWRERGEKVILDELELEGLRT